MAATRKQNVIICDNGSTYTFTGPERICTVILSGATAATMDIKSADGTVIYSNTLSLTFYRQCEEVDIHVDAGCTINKTGTGGACYVYLE